MLPLTYKKPFAAQVAGTVTNIVTGANATLLTVTVLNTTAAAAYLQIFNVAAASVTLGTTTPFAVIPIPASGGVGIDCGWVVNGGGSGVSIAATTTRTGSTGATCDVFILFD